MAHPPGRETLATPILVTSGPRTRTDALMVLTRSYGASQLVRFSVLILTVPSPSILAPRFLRSFLIVLMSTRLGTLRIVLQPGAKRAETMIGREAFLAPLMGTSPRSFSPPFII